jgi:hypothetical protein
MDSSHFALPQQTSVARTKKSTKLKSKKKKKPSKASTKKITTVQEMEENYLEHIEKGQKDLSSSNSSITGDDCSKFDPENDICEDYSPICCSDIENDEHVHDKQYQDSDSNDLFDMNDIIRSNTGVTEELLRIQGKSLEVFQSPYVFQHNPDLIYNHFARLDEQMKAAFNLQTAMITALTCIFAQNLTLQQQNSALHSKLMESLTRINFIRNQNSRANSNINQLLKKNFDLTERIAKQDQILQQQALDLQKTNEQQQSFNQQMQHRTAVIQDTAASIRLNIKHPQSSQPFLKALKTGLIPSQILSTVHSQPNLSFADSLQSPQNNLSTTQPNATCTTKTETNHTLKVISVEHFQSPIDFMNKHLRAIQLKASLPKIQSIFAVKNTTNEFRVRFENAIHRDIWHKYCQSIPEVIVSSQLINLNSTKVRIKGLPTVLAKKGPEFLIKTFCDRFPIQQMELKQIFQFEEKQSPGFSVAVFAISPNARRFFHSKGDSFYFDDLEIAISIEDFLQPLQCSNCHQLGHPTKKCSKPKSCSTCSRHNCQTLQNNQICQNLFCSTVGNQIIQPIKENHAQLTNTSLHFH